MKITNFPSQKRGVRPVAALCLLGLLLAACSPAAETATPTVTDLQATGTPTATIQWFPPTNTPVQVPSQPAGPTADLHPGIGSETLADSFQNPAFWNTTTSETASALVTRGRLVLSLAGHGPTSIASLRSDLFAADFYAEATVDLSLCGSDDQYGMIFRASPGDNYYRFAINCSGEVRLERRTNGQTYPLFNWISSGDATSGAPAHLQLGVWAVGNEIRTFLNDNFQFSVRDPVFHSGTIGFYVYANGKTTITATFTDLLVYSVGYTLPLPSPTFTPTRKP